MTTFDYKPLSARTDKAGHYTWCAEHEGQRTLRAIERCDFRAVMHHARDAAHWAGRVLDIKTDC